MNKFAHALLLSLLLSVSAGVLADSDQDELRTAAMEALISAPPERAFPILQRVLASDDSAGIKSEALFVLSQLELPEAEALLADIARNGSGDLQLEAIRMAGISAAPAVMGVLPDIYASGDPALQDAVLEAYLIAGESQAVFDLASNAQNPALFEAALQTLAAMGETEMVRTLAGRAESADVRVQAYVISGDAQSLRALAMDASDPASQLAAIRNLSVLGDEEAGATLLEIYRQASSQETRQAALEGLMILDDDQAVLALFQASQDEAEKRALLQTLVMMDSEAAWSVIDETLKNTE